MNNRTIIKEAKSIVRLMNHFENINMEEEKQDIILLNLDNVLFELMIEYANNEMEKGNNPNYLHSTIYFRKWIETGEE